MSVHIDTGKPRSKARMRVIPANNHFVSFCLLKHFEHFCLEHRVKCFDGFLFISDQHKFNYLFICFAFCLWSAWIKWINIFIKWRCSSCFLLLLKYALKMMYMLCEMLGCLLLFQTVASQRHQRHSQYMHRRFLQS